jgi:hypothetical protein
LFPNRPRFKKPRCGNSTAKFFFSIYGAWRKVSCHPTNGSQKTGAVVSHKGALRKWLRSG